MNQNLKNIIISVTIGILLTVIVVLLAGGFQKGQFTGGQINADTRRGSSNTYTAFAASSTASLALADTAGCLGLEIQVISGNNTRVYLQATSTGVTASNGIRLALGQGYTPEFLWTGQIWAITETGTSTVGIQCTK